MKMSRIEHVLPFGLLLAGLVLYSLTLCPTIYWGDSAELTTVVKVMGVSHPTGYPLYCLLGKIFTLLPARTIAWRLNFFSAACAAGAMVLVFLAIRTCFFSAPGKTGESLVYALVASTCLGVTYEFWSQAVIAEVYALNMLLLSAVLYVALRWWRVPSRRDEILFGLLAGLCLSHHLQSVFFLAPMGLLFMIRFGLGPSTKQRLVCVLGCALPPLLLYLYLPLRSLANPPIDWGNPETLRNFWWVVSGGQFKLFMWKGIVGQTHLLTYWGRGIWFYARHFWDQWGVIGLFALLGIHYLWQRELAPCLALLLAWFLLVFQALNYDVEDLRIFFLPGYLVATVFIGLGFHALVQWLSTRASASYVKILKYALVLLPFGLIRANYGYIDLSKFTAAEDYGTSVVERVRRPALIITHGDNDIYPLWYQKFVEGCGEGLSVAGANFLSSPWYGPMLQREGLHTQLPSEIFQDRPQWLHAIWNKLISPTLGQKNVYTTQVLLYHRIQWLWPMGVSPGLSWSPLMVPRLGPAGIYVKKVPVRVDYESAPQWYKGYLPPPSIFQFAPIVGGIQGFREIDLGIWVPAEVAR